MNKKDSQLCYVRSDEQAAMWGLRRQHYYVRQVWQKEGLLGVEVIDPYKRKGPQEKIMFHGEFKKCFDSDIFNNTQKKYENS